MCCLWSKSRLAHFTEYASYTLSLSSKFQNMKQTYIDIGLWQFFALGISCIHALICHYTSNIFPLWIVFLKNLHYVLHHILRFIKAYSFHQHICYWRNWMCGRLVWRGPLLHGQGADDYSKLLTLLINRVLGSLSV